MIKLPRIRNLGFWHYHVAGWLFYFLLQFVNTIFSTDLSFKYTLEITNQTISGFFITLLLRYYYRKTNLHPKKLGAILVKVIVASFLATIAWYMSEIGLYYIYSGISLLDELKYQWFLQSIAYLFPVSLGWSALYFGIRFWLAWEEERLRTEKAIAVTQRAQLQILRYQLNPHFLFNTLNSARALIDENVNDARTIITELSEFLRYALQSRNRTNVTLGEELKAMRLYLNIERRRYEDKISVEYDIDPKTEDDPFLSYILHPLVENALKYGMQTSSLPLTLRIKTGKEDGRLRISIINSGRLIPANSKKGIGVENVQNRLSDAFRERQRFRIYEEGGFVHAVIEIQQQERETE